MSSLMCNYLCRGRLLFHPAFLTQQRQVFHCGPTAMETCPAVNLTAVDRVRLRTVKPDMTAISYRNTYCPKSIRLLYDCSIGAHYAGCLLAALSTHGIRRSIRTKLCDGNAWMKKKKEIIIPSICRRSMFHRNTHPGLHGVFNNQLSLYLTGSPMPFISLLLYVSTGCSIYYFGCRSLRNKISPLSHKRTCAIVKIQNSALFVARFLWSHQNAVAQKRIDWRMLSEWPTYINSLKSSLKYSRFAPTWRTSWRKSKDLSAFVSKLIQFAREPFLSQLIHLRNAGVRKWSNAARDCR